MRPANIRNLDARALDGRSRVLVRRAMQTFSPLIGQMWNSRRPLPSALVVGTQRGGTTSLHRLLTSHPNIHPPRRRKGVHYFDLAYGKDLRWYRGAFPIVSAPDIVIETSPYYMFHPEVPGRVAADLPDVKVVVLLRSPIERALSHHHRETERGFEHLSFEAALDAEPERLAQAGSRLAASRDAVDHDHLHFGYQARGLYAEQLERWFAAIGRDRVLVLDSHRLFEGDPATLGELTTFLGVAAFGVVEFPVVNGYDYEAISPALRDRLKSYFAPHDEALVELLGWKPSWC